MVERNEKWDFTQRMDLPYRYEWDYPENRNDFEMAHDYEPYSTTYGEWWMMPGPHVGRGPRGYKRSDERIKNEVCDRLAMNGDLDASNIDMDVHDGQVTLKGSVDSRRSKRLAEDICDSVYGVQDVDNQLQIQRNMAHTNQPQIAGQGTKPQATTTAIEENRPEMYAHFEDQNNIKEGMEVVGPLDLSLGKVKQVRENDFLLNRPLQRDVYVPFSAVTQVRDGQVQLNVPADELDKQGWPMPEIFGPPPPMTGEPRV